MHTKEKYEHMSPQVVNVYCTNIPKINIKKKLCRNTQM